jgi:hypothetical protein
MNPLHDCPQVPVSWGELIDKITILSIKQARIGDAAARRNVSLELALLSDLAASAMHLERVASLTEKLRAVNEDLWAIEDAIREQEAAGDFGARFIALARSVYRENDRRAAIKRAINRELGSALVEEKSYANWTSAVGQARPASAMQTLGQAKRSDPRRVTLRPSSAAP